MESSQGWKHMHDGRHKCTAAEWPAAASGMVGAKRACRCACWLASRRAGGQSGTHLPPPLRRLLLWRLLLEAMLLDALQWKAAYTTC